MQITLAVPAVPGRSGDGWNASSNTCRVRCDNHSVKSRFSIAVLGAALAIAAPGTATVAAAPAQADTGTDVFLSALDHYRLGDIDPATAVRVGESVCPMLAEPGQNMANVAAKVADELGRP